MECRVFAARIVRPCASPETACARAKQRESEGVREKEKELWCPLPPNPETACLVFVCLSLPTLPQPHFAPDLCNAAPPRLAQNPVKLTACFSLTIRDHPATHVFVTGTFDGWKKTEQLEKVGDSFQKTVSLPDASDKIFYKFVVDGNWVVDHTAPKETDASGNENNVLTPERIVSEAPATTAIMNGVTPDATTVGLAANAPLEKKDDETSVLPGAFPETPAAEFGVNPLPATAGALNPVNLAPGEKVPEGVAAESTTSHVRLDPESYEKSDSLPGGAPVTFSSAAAGSTTAELAGTVPLETKVPEVVKESQEKAHAEPEASAVPEEVQEKAAVEEELLEKVQEAPSTSEGTAGKGTEKTENVVTPGEAAASVAAAVSAVAGAAVAGAVIAKDTAVEKATDAAVAAQTTAASAATQLPDSVKEKLPESVHNAIGTTAKEETREEVSPEVPAEVKQSITQAEESPEAAANTEAVQDKKEVEAELLKEVKPVEAVDESSKEAAVPAAPQTTTDAPAVTETPVTTETPVKAVPATTEKPTTSVAAATTETPAAEAATSGVNASTDPATPVTPAPPAKASSPSSSKGTGSPATADKKKKNRLSAMFGKVKAKLSHKD
ncbi:hypothetical protein GGR57DRAFT_509056 [Xylariaceae sp. FL1272]|nr:hypothetical protein GGR57DRAFT_509056 [Xylariaceae sp. FL1272]